jgi:transcriptional regulator with XRE-family HTH domain
VRLLEVPRRARVAERLIQLREDLGLSQEEAAARTEGAIKLRQWQRWESGESEPYKRNLAKLSEVFDIPIGEFFDEPASDPNQLDRIETMLVELLRRSTLDATADALEQELADFVRQGRKPSSADEEDTPGPQRKAQ